MRQMPLLNVPSDESVTPLVPKLVSRELVGVNRAMAHWRLSKLLPLAPAATTSPLLWMTRAQKRPKVGPRVTMPPLPKPLG